MITPAMHIPDGFMSPSVALVGWLLALPALLWAIAGKAGGEESETSVPALLAAFLFAAQTFHFPVPGGTSGHLVGATLVVILCGARMGLTVVAAVVVLQAVVFGDGGLFTLGWNFVNMGLAAGLAGGALYHLLRRRNGAVFGPAFVAAWLGTQMGALCTAMELSVAGITPLSVSLPAMMSVQAVIGLGEGLVTASAVSFLMRVRPHLVNQIPTTLPGLGVILLIGLWSLVPPGVFGDSSAMPAAPAFLGILGLGTLAGLVLGLQGRRCNA